jgi:hypothetical protein
MLGFKRSIVQPVPYSLYYGILAKGFQFAAVLHHVTMRLAGAKDLVEQSTVAIFKCPVRIKAACSSRTLLPMYHMT